MSVHGLCNGLESGIFNMVSASMRARQEDNGGQQAVDMLSDALRRERLATAALRRRLSELEGDLLLARETISLLA